MIDFYEIGVSWGGSNDLRTLKKGANWVEKELLSRKMGSIRSS